MNKNKWRNYKESIIQWVKLFNQELNIRYRFVMLDESNLEEKFSERLTLANVLYVMVFFTLIGIVLSMGILSIPFVRTLIFPSTQLGDKSDLVEVQMKIDSLETQIKNNDSYILKIQEILVHSKKQ